jgi:transcription elongation factor Elf1
MAGIDHNHTNYPVCPYCGHVDKDSSEIDFSSSEVAEVTCGECDMDYTLIQHIEITFTSKS